MQGHLFMRLVMIFYQWPWRLLMLPMEDIEEETKVEIENILWTLSSCCTPPSDGYTIPFRKKVRRKSLIRGPQNLSCLKDTLDRTKATNILNEDRFSRIAHCLHQNQQTSTLATNHSLSEWQTMYELSRKRLVLAIAFGTGVVRYRQGPWTWRQ